MFPVTLVGTAMCWSKEELNITSTNARSLLSGDINFIFITPPMTVVSKIGILFNISSISEVNRMRLLLLLVFVRGIVPCYL